MKTFLRWGQVQRQLTEHLEETGTPYSFLDAARELREKGIFHTAEELPSVSFEEWNVDDLDELEQLLNETPVDLTYLGRESPPKPPAQPVLLHAVKLKGSPIRIAADQSMGTHAHDVFRILYLMRGRARFDLGSTVRVLEEDTVCLASPNFYHDLLVDRGSLMLSIALSNQFVEETLQKLLRKGNVISDFFRLGMGGANSGYLLLHLNHVRQIRSVYRGILHECYDKGEHSEDIYTSYLEILLAMLLRYSTSYESHQIQQHGAMPMLSVLKYIQTHYKETSLNAVAELFHYEPSYLGKQIKTATGKNYTDIVKTLRIEESKRLLRFTELSMDEVAAQAGYDSREHFYRTFRSIEGVTPGQYRKKAQ